jgi:hypothetical protein
MRTAAQNQRMDLGLELTAQYIHDVAVFCLTHGGHLYREYPAERVFKYLAWHFTAGNLAVSFEGEHISGVIIAWKDSAEEIRQRGRRGQPQFNWQLPATSGDAYMIGEVIAKDKTGLTRLLQLASATWPDWKMRKLFTYRRKKLVELSRSGQRFFQREQS